MNKLWIQIVTERMQEKKLSIRQLALKSSTAPGFLARVLRGERNPPQDENLLRKMAKILDFNSDYLIFAAGRIPNKYEKYFLEPNILEKLRNLLNEPFNGRDRKHLNESIGQRGELPDEIL